MNLARSFNRVRALAFRDRLLYAHVGVTHRCNMRCRMCSVPLRADADREAPPEKFRVVAKEIADLGCAMVSLGGGEPFLRKDLPRIVEAFASEGLRVRVLTNGVAPDADALRDVTNAGAADFSISLDSLDAEIQGRIEAMPGALPRKMETISRVIALAPRGVHILNAVVTPLNLDGLLDVARFTRDVGLYSSFIPIHLEAGHPFFTDDSTLGFGPEERKRVNAIYDELLRMRAKGGVINSRAYLMNSRKYLMGEQPDWRCRAGVLYVSVGPDARISICHEFEESESIDPEGFAARYRLDDWRPRARQKSADCDKCYRPCWAEIDHLATDAEAFLGALRLRFVSVAKPIQPLSAEQLLERAGPRAVGATI